MNGDRLLLPDAYLHPQTASYVVKVSPKKSAKSVQAPPASCTGCSVALLTTSGTRIHQCRPGDSAAQVLHDLGLPPGFAQILGSDGHADLHVPLCADVVLDLRPPVLTARTPGVVSDADLDSALQRIRNLLPAEVACLPTSLVSALAGLSVDDARHFGCYKETLPLHCRLLLPFTADGHWACMRAQIQPDCLSILYLDGVPDRPVAQAQHLGRVLAVLLGRATHHFQSLSWFVQGEADSCGIIMLRHLCACVAGLGPQVESIVQQLLQAESAPGRVLGSGDLSSEQLQQLKAFLQTKGVPTASVEERAQTAIRKLGPGPIAHALAHKKPWAQLKVIAGRPGVAFR